MRQRGKGVWGGRPAPALVGLLLLAGCGGRSSLSVPPGVKFDGRTTQRDAAVSRDAAWRADTAWRADAAWPVADARPIPDRALAPDLAVPRDFSWPADSCIPLPASLVQGPYKGNWTGTWKCPQQKAQKVSGTLELMLLPAGSPDGFQVQGSMQGTLDPGLPLGGPVTGSMSCTSLQATMPNIVVGSGGIIYTLSGTLSGVFQATPQGFAGTKWTASQKNGMCQAWGSWYAFR